MKTSKAKSKNATIWKSHGILPDGYFAADRIAGLLEIATLVSQRHDPKFIFSKELAMEVVKEMDFQFNELPRRTKVFQKKHKLRF